MKHCFLILTLILGIPSLSICQVPSQINLQSEDSDGEGKANDSNYSNHTTALGFDFRPIYFAPNSYKLNREARHVLNELYKYLQQHPTLSIKLEGHTDAVGDMDSNKDLSKNRARMVRGYLTKKGIEAYRIPTAYFGESVPVAINQFRVGLDAPEGRFYNRRVDITILDSNQYTLYTTATDDYVPLEFRIREDERLKNALPLIPNSNVAQKKSGN